MSMDTESLYLFTEGLERMVSALATPTNKEPRLSIDLAPEVWQDLKDSLWLLHGKNAMPLGPNMILAYDGDPRCDGRPGFFLMGQWIRRVRTTHKESTP